MSLSPSRFLAAFAFIVGLSAVAFAARSSGERAQAEHLLKQLASAEPSLVKEPVENSRAALKRADDLRAAGDLANAELAEGLAYEWAGTAHDLTRASAAEKELAKVEEQLNELDTKELRARAVLEETIARRERAKGKLLELEKQSSANSPSAPSTPASSAKP